MRVLVIGTSGQLATELHRGALPADLELLPREKLDLTDLPGTLAALDRLQPELILNAAAYTAVDRAEAEAEAAFAINAHAPEHLARWCNAHGCALFHVSTDYVFDGTKQEPYEEQDEVRPLGTYGASKLAGELAVARVLEHHLILRTSWVFSAHGNNFVKTMLRLAAQRDELKVVADQAGRPTAAADLARVMLELAGRYARQRSLAFGTYHFAGEGQTTWHGFAAAIIEARHEREPQRRVKVSPITTADYPTPAKRPQSSVLATGKFERTFDLYPAAWRSELRDVIRELYTAS
jgi:dTDP-4-dehydrorhamnose reductase